MQFELTDEIRNLIVFAMEDQGNSYLFDSVDQKTVIESTITCVDEDRYYKIPTWDSMKGFKLMERFISLLRNPLAREELRGVLLSGKGVFRNFKNVLHQYPEVEKLWFSFKEKEMRLIVSNWYDTFLDSWGLEKLGFEPEENSDVVYDDFVFRVAYENHDNCQNDSELLFSASEMFCQEFEKQHQSEIGFTLSELWKSQLNSFNPESEFSVIAETVEGDFAGACITFGYEEGAFTGAKKKGSIGKFELADGSTIFLDEIGDMPLHVQTKLLRVLQENVVERIGGTKPIPIDIRVICATNKNIEQMVEEGTFREDLYYRLNIIPIELPPLRKRKEDLPALIDYYIAYYNQKLSKAMTGVSKDALQTLMSYNWPGNVRELKNIIEYLANISEKDEIQLSDLPDHIVLRSEKGFEDWSLDDIVSEYEKRVLGSMIKKGASLEEKNGLAETLKISRATLYRKLKKYDLL